MAWSQHSRIMDANTQHRLKNEQPLGTEFSKGVKEVVGMIPEDNPVINTVGAALGGFADQWSQTMPGRIEDAALDWVGKQAPKINVDPLAARMLVGMVLPGPGEMNVAKRAVRTGRLLNAVDQNSVVKPAQRLLDIEAENALAATKHPKLTSTRATVTSDPTDIQVYDKYSQRQAVKLEVPKELGGKLGQRTRIEGVNSKHFHHIFIKDLAAEYVETARKIGLPDDVIELDRIAKKYGFGLGNYKSAGIYADKIPHGLAHDKLIEQGIQPSGKALASKKTNIQSHKDIKQLHADFEQSIKELALPLKEEVESLQDAWDSIPSADRLKLIQLRLQREAMRKRFKSITKGQHPELDKATEAYAAHKKKMLSELDSIVGGRAQHIENVTELNLDEAVEQAHRSGLSVKKTKPTEWSELRKRNIPIDVKLYGKSEWKVGDAKVTWYPDPDDPLKGRGQIDILDQASNTKPKGVKALIKDFNDAIKEFPSGTKVELNPMWKDAKRRSIYENYVFKNNPNIKPNPDDTLGWIYTAP